MLSALNQIFKTHYLILSIYLILTANNLAQMEGYYNCVPDEGVGTLSIEAIQMGGRYIPSRDTFHVLVVFVQFPDDNFDTTNTLWPKGQPPTYLNTFVDLNASINSQPAGFTVWCERDYFRPDTTLIPRLVQGLPQQLIVQIEDRNNAKDENYAVNSYQHHPTKWAP